jgi:CRP-like cAMP-binding protein
VADFEAEVGRSGALREAVRRYTGSLLRLVGQSVACNCLHTVGERCAKWLLMTRDRVGADEFPLTHEFLAMMLGVRRASVTVTAGTLQKAGLIAYRHGRVRVLDPAGLEEASCECYRVARDEFHRPLR